MQRIFFLLKILDRIYRQGRRSKYGQGEELFGPARSKISLPGKIPPPSLIFTPLWAYFLNFFSYIVRMTKSSGGSFPPQFYA